MGTRVRHDVLEAVGGLSGQELLEAVEELLSTGVFREVPGLHAITYEFIHPLLRDNFYSG